MALAGKVKTALDETRTLILGAQILVGFQFQSAFQEQFDSLPTASRIICGIALALMLAAIGLLIAPSAFHRIAERGQTTGRIHSLAGYFAATALVPFAVALGLDLTITLERAVWRRRRDTSPTSLRTSVAPSIGLSNLAALLAASRRIAKGCDGSR